MFAEIFRNRSINTHLLQAQTSESDEFDPETISALKKELPGYDFGDAEQLKAFSGLCQSLGVRLNSELLNKLTGSNSQG